MGTAESTPPRCPACGEVVGAYEPAIAVTADGMRLPGARRPPHVEVAEVYHRDCLDMPER